MKVIKDIPIRVDRPEAEGGLLGREGVVSQIGPLLAVMVTAKFTSPWCLRNSAIMVMVLLEPSDVELVRLAVVPPEHVGELAFAGVVYAHGDASPKALASPSRSWPRVRAAGSDGAGRRSRSARRWRIRTRKRADLGATSRPGRTTSSTTSSGASRARPRWVIRRAWRRRAGVARWSLHLPGAVSGRGHPGAAEHHLRAVINGTSDVEPQHEPEPPRHPREPALVSPVGDAEMAAARDLVEVVKRPASSPSSWDKPRRSRFCVISGDGFWDNARAQPGARSRPPHEGDIAGRRAVRPAAARGFASNSPTARDPPVWRHPASVTWW